MSKQQTYPQIVYPEMYDYPWVKDLPRVLKVSKFVSGGGILSDLPKIPINFLLTVMREAASRPEVMEAYASAPLDGQIPPRESHLLTWHNEYLQHNSERCRIL